ncbi:uncharacterized protein PV09_01385 [Verruconis gallopava]|uniref:Uncharacterized protein n=1 Tax=Verruconis gallopava TaxID=253628 RepID=A0A0D2BB52_9PEZI|nr:uncharacterized protein PV09_01385 [Verruconis gallopava]KIW08489.1 hypothetical protein PV09_01385 [Verruconis gallopava]
MPEEVADAVNELSVGTAEELLDGECRAAVGRGAWVAPRLRFLVVNVTLQRSPSTLSEDEWVRDGGEEGGERERGGGKEKKGKDGGWKKKSRRQNRRRRRRRKKKKKRGQEGVTIWRYDVRAKDEQKRDAALYWDRREEGGAK